MPKPKKPLDENDKLLAGVLPEDPFADTVEWDHGDAIRYLDRRAWEGELLRTDQGVAAVPGNAALYLGNHPDWEGCLRYDAFADQITWAKQPPIVVGLKRPAEGEPLRDHHALYAHHALRKAVAVNFKPSDIHGAMVSAAHMNAVHPLQSWLRSLSWDGTERLSLWLHRYLGCEDTDYTSAVGQWWLISAVARALRPGCQVDHTLVLEGRQGAGKSSGLRALAGAWYLGSLPNFRDAKAVAEVMQGHWIVEIGELDAMKGAAFTRVKDFLSQTKDVYRPPYSRNATTRPRCQVFAGTTNESAYLSDPTGARRFWPVRTGRIDVDAIERDREQLFAEAVASFKDGSAWWLGPNHPELAAEIREQQEQRHDTDAWEQRIAEWLDGRDTVSIGEVLGGAMALEPARWEPTYQLRVAGILTRLGWRRERAQVDGRRTRAWRRPL